MAKRSSKSKSKKSSASRKPQTQNTASNKPKGGSSTSKATPAANTEARSSRARERRLERQKEKRRQQQMTIAISLVAIAVIAVIFFVVVNQPASAPIQEEILTRYENIPVEFTDDGFATLGSPDAPVLVEEFSSFSCPSCAVFHESQYDFILEQVEAGIISFRYIPLQLGSLPNAAGAANAAYCAGEQDKYFEMHDVLFDWHTRFANQAFTQNRLSSGAENLGLNMSEYNSCIGSGRPGDVLDAAIEEASARGVAATPSLAVNGTLLDTQSDLEAAILTAFQSSGLPAVPLVPAGDEPLDDPAGLTETGTDGEENTEESDSGE